MIARAEKAARALEAAEPKSPLTRALLQEARELIADARRSVQSIDSGQRVTSHDAVGGAAATRRRVNGGLVSSSTQRNAGGLRLTNFPGQTPRLGGPLPEVVEEGSNGGMISSPFGVLGERSGVDPFDAGKKDDGLTSSQSKPRKRWVRGRLIDVQEN